MQRNAGKAKNITTLLVSWFQSFVVSKVLGFKVSWFRSFKDLPIVISSLLEENDPISQNFKELLDGSSGFIGARLFENFKFVGFLTFLILLKQYFANDL